MKTIKVSDATYRAIADAAVLPFRSTGDRLPDGDWLVPVENDTYDHINLLETLCEKILDYCLSEEQVHGVRLAVEKPDIFPEMQGVGIEMERWRENDGE